ncbi:MAG TPA: malonyl-CoA decarboxylase family protein [Usitatibacter sp.]
MSIIDRMLGSLAAKPRGIRRADRLAGLLRTLISERGEATGAVLARRAVALYRGLDETGRERLFEKLARDFAPDPALVLKAAVSYHADPSPAHLATLQRVTEPARQEIFRRMNMAPGGTAVLVQMRRELLDAMKTHPEFEAVDHDLTHLLGSWFNRGFLELRRIDWGTPAAILEKLIKYEAVHRIQGFPDLKRRLENDRRCFAFFHPALTDEPIIFVEVAFVTDLPADVGPILAMESAVGDPRRARCAVFYSITNCQPGLRGISFGNFLIKQVAEDLHGELPNLKVFATLSPVPGFRTWVTKKLGAAAPQGASAIDANRQKLESLAAWYLTREWSAGQALDPVARFHLGNGARLERLNWMADASERGIAQSFGLMVNYVYDLGDVERNHEEYVNRHRVVASGGIEKLAEGAAAWVEKAAGAPISSS